MARDPWQARLQRVMGVLLLYSATSPAYAACCLLLALRCWPYVAVGALLMLHGHAYNQHPESSYGFDFLATSALCYCLLPAAGAASRRWMLWGLRLHLAVVYFFSGWHKWLGYTWHDGQALWKALNLPQFKGLLHGDWLARLADFPWLFTGCGLAVVLLEVGYPLLCAARHTRKAGVISIMGLHAGIALVMGLYQFSALMLILNAVAWWPGSKN